MSGIFGVPTLGDTTTAVSALARVETPQAPTPAEIAATQASIDARTAYLRTASDAQLQAVVDQWDAWQAQVAAVRAAGTRTAVPQPLTPVSGSDARSTLESRVSTRDRDAGKLVYGGAGAVGGYFVGGLLHPWLRLPLALVGGLFGVLQGGTTGLSGRQHRGSW